MRQLCADVSLIETLFANLEQRVEQKREEEGDVEEKDKYTIGDALALELDKEQKKHEAERSLPFCVIKQLFEPFADSLPMLFEVSCLVSSCFVNSSVSCKLLHGPLVTKGDKLCQSALLVRTQNTQCFLLVSSYSRTSQRQQACLQRCLHH